MNDNLKRLHASLQRIEPEFNVPLEQFAIDMQDTNNRRRLHENLQRIEPEFNVPYDVFSTDLGFYPDSMVVTSIDSGEQKMRSEERKPGIGTWLGDLGEGMLSTLANIGGGTAYDIEHNFDVDSRALQKAKEVIKTIPPGDPRSENLKKFIDSEEARLAEQRRYARHKRPSEFLFEKRDELSDRSHDYYGTVTDADGTVRPKDYSDLWKEGRYGAALGQILLEGGKLLPTTFAAMAPGGLAVISAASVGSKLRDIENDPAFKDVPSWKRYLDATMTGVLEGATEKLGAKVDMKMIEPFLQKMGEETVKQILAKGGINALIQTVSEGVEEVVSQTGENVADLWAGAKEWDGVRSVTEGVGDAFVYGVGGGAPMGGATMAASGVRSANRAVLNNRAKRAEGEFIKSFVGKEDDGFASSFREAVNGTDKEKAQEAVMTARYSDNLTDEQKNSAIAYYNSAADLKGWERMKPIQSGSSPQQKTEGLSDEEIRAKLEPEIPGQIDEVVLTGARDMKRAMRKEMDRLLDGTAFEMSDKVEELGQDELFRLAQAVESAENLTTDQKAGIMSYLSSLSYEQKAKERFVEDGVRASEEAFANEFGNKVNQSDGSVTYVSLPDGSKGHVIAGNLSYKEENGVNVIDGESSAEMVYVRNESDGRIVPVNTNGLVLEQSIGYSDLLKQKTDEARARLRVQSTLHVGDRVNLMSDGVPVLGPDAHVAESEVTGMNEQGIMVKAENAQGQADEMFIPYTDVLRMIAPAKDVDEDVTNNVYVNGVGVKATLTRNDDGSLSIVDESGNVAYTGSEEEALAALEVSGFNASKAVAGSGEASPIASEGGDVSEPVPVSRGVFGDIYDQFKGKAKEAISFLTKKKSGEATGALHHKDIGEISLVWGNEKMGLAHIIGKHPEVLDGIQERIDDMNIVNASDNRVVLESNTHKAVVSRMLGQEKTPQWLLTAYEKKNASGGSSDIVPEPETGKQNGTAPLQDIASTDKGSESVSTLQYPTDENGAPVPVGTNRWGDVYQWATGKVKEAADFLRKKQSGYLKGVFHRDGIGDIDLVWGDEKGGLKHIIQKHIVEHDDFDSVEEAMQVIDEVVKKGDVELQKNGNYKINYNGHAVAVAKDELGNWLITAFDTSRKQEDKKRNPADATRLHQSISMPENGELVSPGGERQRSKGNTTIGDQNVSDGANGTLVSPQLASTDKGSESAGSMQESSRKSIPQDEQGQPIYEQAEPDAAWDALVAQTGGDESMAQRVADSMVADKEAALKKAESAKLKTGTTVSEKIAAEKERKAIIEEAQRQVESWKRIAGTAQRRKAEAERNSQPEDMTRTDEDWYGEVAERSEDLDEILSAYDMAMSQSESENLLPWQEELLTRQIHPESFYRYGDRNWEGDIRLWLTPKKAEQRPSNSIDTLAEELSLYGVEVTPDMIVDFMMSHPRRKAETGNEYTRALGKRFSDVASRLSGSRTGAPNTLSGKKFINSYRGLKKSVEDEKKSYIARFNENIDNYLNSAYAEEQQRRNLEDAEEISAVDGRRETVPGSSVQADDAGVGTTGGSISGLDGGPSGGEGTGVRESENGQEIHIGDGVPATGYAQQAVRSEDGRPEETADLRGDNGMVGHEGLGRTAGMGSEDLRPEERRGEAERDAAVARVRRALLGETNENSAGRKEQLELIEREAKTQGVWTEDHYEFGPVRDIGGENEVHREDGENVVYKLNDFAFAGDDLMNFFERIDAHNELFPESRYKLVGFGKNRQGKTCAVLEQDFIDGKKATEEEIEAGMSALGFEMDYTDVYHNDRYEVFDVVPENVLKDEDGKLYFIDTQIMKRADSMQDGTLGEKIADAEAETDTNPSEAQKEAGNYKKGHVRIDGYDVTIEQPKGSVRRGTDENGKSWETTMQHTYGYIRGTQGVDGDHIDIFLSDHPENGNVYVVDQVNPKTGAFDEHKVMYGFGSLEDAKSAYLSNYEDGWNGLGTITEVSKNEFKKWVNSSHRKTKPFSEYVSVNKNAGQSVSQGTVETSEKTPQNEISASSVDNKVSDWGSVSDIQSESLPVEEKSVSSQKTSENGTSYEVSESISQREHRTVLERDGGLEQASLRLRESRRADEAESGGSGTSLSEQERLRDDAEAVNSVGRIENNSRQSEIAPSPFQYFTGTLTELIAQAKQSAQGLIKKVIAPISSRLKNDLNRQGLQIDDDYNHVIDNNAIRHTLKKHSGKNEEKRGQIPIVDADFENIADVVEHYDGVEVLQEKTSAQRIIYHKIYQDGTVVFVEEQRVGRKELAAVTMWKKKNPNLTDANRTETTLISDLTEVSDDKDTTNSPKANELGEKVADAETGHVVLFNISSVSSPMTETQEVVFGAVSEMLGNAGIPVEVLSNEAMEQLADMDAPVLEAKRKSEARAERERVNGTIDRAVSYVTGKSIGEVRSERMRMEQARRDSAKEIYDSVLRNDFNALVLQRINDYIDDATPKNPYGRRISQRVPQAMERSLHAGERTNAVDALFTRISESSVGEAGAKLAGDRSSRESAKAKKKELLKGWAIATGNWHTDIHDFTNDTEPVASGKDSDVYYSKDGRFVIKFSKGKSDKRFSSDIDASNLFSFVFPSTAYDIVGYGEINGEFVTILRQPVVDIESALTEGERVEYMRSLGYHPINKENTAFSNGEIVVSDLQKGNIVRSKDGNVRVIDADVKLHTRDIGGNYTYPSASVDTEDRLSGRPQLMTVYHGSTAVFDAFDHSHMGEGEGAQAYGWGSYVTEVEGIGRAYAGKKRGRVSYKGKTINDVIDLYAQNVSPYSTVLSVIERMEDGMNFSEAKETLESEWRSELEYDEANGNKEYAEGWRKNLSELGELEESDFNVIGSRNLYTVEIPDDTGENYLEWDKVYNEEEIQEIVDRLNGDNEKYGIGDFEGELSTDENLRTTGKEIYEILSDSLKEDILSDNGDPQKASNRLSKAGFVGISYPAQYTTGGRADGARNYVIFNEKDLEIKDRIQFMRGKKKAPETESVLEEHQHNNMDNEKSPDTATMQRTWNGFGNKATVISGDTATKVVGNLEKAKSQPVSDESNGRNVRLNARQKNMLDTAERSYKTAIATVVSSNDGANILKNIDSAIVEYGKRDSNRTKTFLGDLSASLNLHRTGKSQYGTFETKNGKVVTIRVSNHNATVSNFDNLGESDGLSIVITRKPNRGIVNDGDAHVVEYFYPEIAVNRSDGKPLVEILKSIKQALYSGEYTDTTGMAEVQEVNASSDCLWIPGQARNDVWKSDDVRNGVVYGATVGGKIYLNGSALNPETPLHEYTHIWDEACMNGNPELWKRGVELMKQTPMWDEVRNDPNYADLQTDDEIASEVHSRLTGADGAARMERMVDVAKGSGSLGEQTRVTNLVNRLRQWLNEFWWWFRDTMTPWTRGDAERISLEDFVNMPIGELVKKASPSLSEGGYVNARFNAALEKFTIKDADNFIFNLGMPSNALLAGGVEDKPIKLYGSKVAKKMRKHGFKSSELKNLPLAVANPIAVFNNTERPGNRSVLTELKTEQGNILVTLDLGKWMDADFDIVSSVFGKSGNSIVHWINNGYATFINKEKALDYLHLSAPIAEASDNQELSRATKIVESFENPKVSVEDEGDVLYRDDDTLYRIREDAPPLKTGIGYKVFVLKNDRLYPPMVANPDGAETPIGVWLDADAAPIAGQSKTGRNQVKAGGKGTQGGSGKLAYRPGWHLGEIPYALQFNRADEDGNKVLFPANFVWAEVEYADDVDYQSEAMSYGINQNGKFQHSLAGLPRVPKNGSYRYRTNPNPETDPWIITGAMKVNRLLKPTEVDLIVMEAGRKPQVRQKGAFTDLDIERLNDKFFQEYRDGLGLYTDDELSYENDPVAKLMGRSKRTKSQRKAFAERERQRMVGRVTELAERLHLDNVVVVTDVSTLDGRKSKAKGFYDKRTGKITIVVPNHVSVFDVEQTLLHEAVAHHGLRRLFGEHFETFLDNVYANADSDVRKRIDALVGKYDGNVRTATEEYLASLAEESNFEDVVHTSWWGKIKHYFLQMLHKIGFEDFGDVTLSDNELRYLLWRSYENLKEPGRYRSIIGEARDVVMQDRLKVGNYSGEVADIGERVADSEYSVEAVNERFNAELEYFKENRHKGLLHLGIPGPVLRVCGIDKELTLSPTVLSRKLKQHGIPVDSLKNLAAAIQRPILVYKHGEHNPNIVVVTGMEHEGGRISVSVELDGEGHVVELNNISSVHNKEALTELERLSKLDESSLEDALRWVDKVKVSDWLGIADLNSPIHTDNPKLLSVANVIKDFENPKIEKGKLLDSLFGITNPGFNQETFPASGVKDRKLLSILQDAGDENVLFREENKLQTLQEILEDGLLKASQHPEASVSTYLASLRLSEKKVNNAFMIARHASTLRKEDDRDDVKELTGIARQFLQSGAMREMTPGEVSSLLYKIEQGTGKDDLHDAVYGLSDILMKSHLRTVDGAINKMLNTKTRKKSQSGVSVSGAVDAETAEMLEYLKELTDAGVSDETLNTMLSGDESGDGAEVNRARRKAIELALDYNQNVRRAEENVISARHAVRDAEKALVGVRGDRRKVMKDGLSALKDSYLETEALLVDQKTEWARTLATVIVHGRSSKREWADRKQSAKDHIRHYMNSDFLGVDPLDRTPKGLIQNGWLWQGLFSPLRSFSSILKSFGRRASGGEGYLYRHFMGEWFEASNNAYLGMKSAVNELDRKTEELFGIKHFNDLVLKTAKQPKVRLKKMDRKDGSVSEMELRQGNALYVYMVNKMTDGKVKLRRMGISDEYVSEMATQIDPRLRALGDWIQERFLPERRKKYDSVHKELFGVGMRYVENYFPLNIQDTEVYLPDPLSGTENGVGKLSNVTNHIKERVYNTHAIDIEGTDALAYLLKTTEEMEEWSAFARFREDLNTLLSDPRFRKLLNGVKGLYGSGNVLYNNFKKSAQIAGLVYHPDLGSVNKFWLNMARLTTLSKVGFNLNTALKQLLSFPAVLGDADLRDLWQNPIKAYKWCLENLPDFHNRIDHGVAGNTYIDLDEDKMYKMFKTRVADFAVKWGMKPNAFVDSLVSSFGAYATYKTTLRDMKKEGYTDEVAEREALLKAQRSYNEMQQSDMGAFVSDIQRTPNLGNLLVTTFANAPIAYGRRLAESVRDLGRIAGHREEMVERTRKMMVRDGVPEIMAERSARHRIRKQAMRDVVNIALSGFVLEAVFQLGGSALYLLPELFGGGDDEDEKKKIVESALIAGAMSPLKPMYAVSTVAEWAVDNQYKNKKYDLELFSLPFSDDLERIGRSFGNGNWALMAEQLIELSMAVGTGINVNTITNMMYGLYALYEGDDAGEKVTGLLKNVLNMPKSEQRRFYLDAIEKFGEQSLDDYVTYLIRKDYGILAPAKVDDARTKAKYRKKVIQELNERYRLTSDE